MAVPLPSPAVLAARQRRAAGAASATARVEDFSRAVGDRIALTMEQRVKLAVLFVRDRVVRNISRPVTKGTGPKGGRIATNRSKPGEFPKADTTQLMKSIFDDIRKRSGSIEGYVGTTLDYGLILEVKMDRSFLVRTLREEQKRIADILTGPIT